MTTDPAIAGGQPTAVFVNIGERTNVSGSDAIRLRKRVIAASASSIASSMLTSMICAPASTCWRAISSAVS